MWPSHVYAYPFFEDNAKKGYFCNALGGSELLILQIQKSCPPFIFCGFLLTFVSVLPFDRATERTPHGFSHPLQE